MPGPNDFYFDKNGQLQPGLGPEEAKGGVAVREPPRLDGRTVLAKKEKALEKAVEQFNRDQQAFEAERAAFYAEKKAKEGK